MRHVLDAFPYRQCGAETMLVQFFDDNTFSIVLNMSNKNINQSDKKTLIPSRLRSNPIRQALRQRRHPRTSTWTDFYNGEDVPILRTPVAEVRDPSVRRGADCWECNLVPGGAPEHIDGIDTEFEDYGKLKRTAACTVLNGNGAVEDVDT